MHKPQDAASTGSRRLLPLKAPLCTVSQHLQKIEHAQQGKKWPQNVVLEGALSGSLGDGEQNL